MALTNFTITDSTNAVHTLSNINRSFDISLNKVVQDQRTSTGMLRRRFMANKRQFTFKWEWLPFLNSAVLDGGSGGQDLESLFNLGGVMTLAIPDDSTLGNTDHARCVIALDGFQHDDQYIESSLYWNLTLTLEEV